MLLTYMPQLSIFIAQSEEIEGWVWLRGREREREGERGRERERERERARERREEEKVNTAERTSEIEGGMERAAPRD